MRIVADFPAEPPEKAEKAVSETRMERKCPEASEKDFSTAESRQISWFAQLGRYR